ncbi:DUF1649-domain-containing protein [Pseudovirgaria hyperparasitica]|uniref:Autophagy-related protein 101 n=1 Tax=Pseudovirgaria hyperparasitica TaxID=470096 RepID=A0A6A6W4Y9_9PEZI|nr:DUF1649-domain-containing protein [Pseudovirgaria hyperparasitica]KAF2756121.1 DUF1649-domain-containing protein [Pseudovirgaria hyperparasitica]
MEQRRAPEYTLDVFADPTCVKDVIKALLHTIFFHRLFPPLSPYTRDLLDQTLPCITDNNLETLIDQQATSLVRAIESGTTPQRGRGQLAVLFYEKTRKKTYFSYKDDKVCWEQWRLDVTLATPRYESDVPKVRRAQEKSLHKAAMKIVTIVNKEKDHIPPITTTEANPFPYELVVNPKNDGWGQRMGIF